MRKGFSCSHRKPPHSQTKHAHLALEPELCAIPIASRPPSPDDAVSGLPAERRPVIGQDVLHQHDDRRDQLDATSGHAAGRCAAARGDGPAERRGPAARLGGADRPDLGPQVLHRPHQQEHLVGVSHGGSVLALVRLGAAAGGGGGRPRRGARARAGRAVGAGGHGHSPRAGLRRRRRHRRPRRGKKEAVGERRPDDQLLPDRHQVQPGAAQAPLPLLRPDLRLRRLQEDDAHPHAGLQ